MKLHTLVHQRASVIKLMSTILYEKLNSLRIHPPETTKYG